MWLVVLVMLKPCASQMMTMSGLGEMETMENLEEEEVMVVKFL